jgi:hypothetical protein
MVIISAVTLDLVTEASHGFPQSLQGNGGIVLKNGSRRFLAQPFQFTIHHHPLIRRCVAGVAEVTELQLHMIIFRSSGAANENRLGNHN